MKSLLAFLLTLTVVTLVSAGGGNGCTLQSGFVWNNTSPSTATIWVNYQNHGGTSEVDGVVTYTFGNGSPPDDAVVDTQADELGFFELSVPAYVTSIDLDVVVDSQRDKPKRFQCFHSQ